MAIRRTFAMRITTEDLNRIRFLKMKYGLLSSSELIRILVKREYDKMTKIEG